MNHKLDHLISTAVRFHPWTAVTGNQVSLWIKFLLQDHTRGLTIEFKFRVSTYNIRALTYNIKEFL